MAWGSGTCIPGTGNLLLQATDALAAGTASLTAVAFKSLTVISGAAVQTATNVGGSAAAITGNPVGYLQVNIAQFGGDCLIPIYRKT